MPALEPSLNASLEDQAATPSDDVEAAEVSDCSAEVSSEVDEPSEEAQPAVADEVHDAGVAPYAPAASGYRLAVQTPGSADLAEVAALMAMQLGGGSPAAAAREPAAAMISKPRLKKKSPAAPAGRTKKGATAAALLDAPDGAFAAEVRCAARVGSTVWAAERDGCIVVREASSGKLIERLMTGLQHQALWDIVAVGEQVWCGTETGPILIFGAKSRSLLKEARQHSGAVHCLCASPTTASGFVVSGGSDWRLMMWGLDGKLIRQYSGHTGAVRCVIVVGMSIWTGGDDRTVRVWDVAYGMWNLETDPCRATLTGHTGSVHALLAHADGVLSCAADGTIRVWRANAGGGGAAGGNAAGGGSPTSAHECLREVLLPCGPVYTMVPMGKAIWAAGQDGVIHALDGCTLEAVASPRQGHAGFVSGLCRMTARTTRTCWSYSLSDGKVCVWRTDEVEAQHSAEAAATLQTENQALTAALTAHSEERRQEQLDWAEERASGAARLEETEAALADARAGQASLLAELAASVEEQEKDVLECERLRTVLSDRETQLADATRRAEAAADEATAASERQAEAEQRAIDAEGATAAARAETAGLSAQLRRQQAGAERLARRVIAEAVRARVAARAHVGSAAAGADERLEGGAGEEREAAALAMASAGPSEEMDHVMERTNDTEAIATRGTFGGAFFDDEEEEGRGAFGATLLLPHHELLRETTSSRAV